MTTAQDQLRRKIHGLKIHGLWPWLILVWFLFGVYVGLAAAGLIHVGLSRGPGQ